MEHEINNMAQALCVLNDCLVNVSSVRGLSMELRVDDARSITASLYKVIEDGQLFILENLYCGIDEDIKNVRLKVACFTAIVSAFTGRHETR